MQFSKLNGKIPICNNKLYIFVVEKYGYNMMINMRKFLTMAAIAVAVFFSATSCLVNDNDVVVRNFRLISLIDGDATTGLYGIFDDGTTVYITNSNSIPAIPAEYFHKGEARALIDYEVESHKVAGYDHTIRINGYECIRTSDIYNGLDEHIPSEYNEGLEIYEMSYTRNNITFNFIYRTSNFSDKIAQHDFIMVYNTSETHEGPHKDAYQDDGFLYLELYHDIKDDLEQYDNLTKRNFKLDADLLGINLLDYRGIKIIHKTLNDRQSKVVTLTEFK